MTGGAVTFADALFFRAGGTENLSFGGFGGYVPSLVDLTDFNPVWGTNSGQTTFTPANTASVPEPSAILGLVGLGLLGFGAKLKKKSA